MIAIDFIIFFVTIHISMFFFASELIFAFVTYKQSLKPKHPRDFCEIDYEKIKIL